MGAFAGGVPSRPVRLIHQESVGWALAFSVLLILLGLAALALPLAAGIAVTALIAWLLLFGGVAHLVFAFHVRGAGAHLWEALVGVAYLVAGVFLFLHPLAGLVSLTLFLGAYLFVKGVLEVVTYIATRGLAGGIWLLLDGVISVLLALMIWAHLPYAATWAVGTLLGIAILFSGISRLALSLAARRGHAATV